MMRDGRHLTHMREFGDEMCRRIVAAGIPLWRAFCSVGTLHPQVYGSAYIWRRDTPGAVRFTATHSFENDAEYAPSIVQSICAGRQGVCLSAERLKTQAGVPIEWDAQQRLLAD